MYIYIYTPTLHIYIYKYIYIYISILYIYIHIIYIYISILYRYIHIIYIYIYPLYIYIHPYLLYPYYIFTYIYYINAYVYFGQISQANHTFFQWTSPGNSAEPMQAEIQLWNWGAPKLLVSPSQKWFTNQFINQSWFWTLPANAVSAVVVAFFCIAVQKL